MCCRMLKCFPTTKPNKQTDEKKNVEDKQCAHTFCFQSKKKNRCFLPKSSKEKKS